MCGMHNPDLLEQMSEIIISKDKDDALFEPGDESEVVNLLSGLSNLGHRNEAVYEIIYKHLVGPNFAKTGEIEGQYDFYTLFNIISSFGRSFPQKTKYFNDFVPQLHEVFTSLQKMDPKEFEANPEIAYHLVPDITLFVNLWLTIGAFAAM
jgi:hypothetical protein